MPKSELQKICFLDRLRFLLKHDLIEKFGGAMSIWKFILVFQLLIITSVTYGQLPACMKYGNQPSEVAIDKNSGRIVFFDQTGGDRSQFQVWDLNSKKKIKEGELPDKYYYILGFIDMKTIAFARSYDPIIDMRSFGPILHYHLDTDVIDVIAVDAGLRVTAYSLSANLAVGYGKWGQRGINLTTGEMSELPPMVKGWTHFQFGFSQDGLKYYSVNKANEEYDTKRLVISKWEGPQFFDSEPKVIAYVEPQDVGIKNPDDYMSAGGRAVSESGKSFALTLSAYYQTPDNKTEITKLMWLNLTTGQKTFCDIEYGGIPSVQIVDEKAKTLLLQSDASFYHFRRLVDMNTCAVSSFPQMKGVKEVLSGRLIQTSRRNLYFNTGGVWDLISGETILRSCE